MRRLRPTARWRWPPHYVSATDTYVLAKARLAAAYRDGAGIALKATAAARKGGLRFLYVLSGLDGLEEATS